MLILCKKNAGIDKSKGVFVLKVSSIILTGFREGLGIYTPPSPPPQHTAKWTPKKSTLIRVKTTFISALMIVVNLLFFSSLNRCFVYLCFKRTCLKPAYDVLAPEKDEKNYERLVLVLFLRSF